MQAFFSSTRARALPSYFRHIPTRSTQHPGGLRSRSHHSLYISASWKPWGEDGQKVHSHFQDLSIRTYLLQVLQLKHKLPLGLGNLRICDNVINIFIWKKNAVALMIQKFNSLCLPASYGLYWSCFPLFWDVDSSKLKKIFCKGATFPKEILLSLLKQQP